MSLFRVRASGALLVLLLAAAACSPPASEVASERAAASASTDASGSVEASAEASVEASVVSVFDLEVGDCFNTDDVSTVDEVALLSCGAGHRYEVFGITDYEANAAATFPGDEALSATADGACRTAFEVYVGVAFDDSEWFATFINPSEETWANGDREIVCVLHAEDATEVMGSAEGSNS